MPGSSCAPSATRCSTVIETQPDRLRGFVLAPLRKLAALLLDLAEQPRVLDRQHRVGCERLQKLNCIFGKIARLLAPNDESSDDAVCADQRHDEARSKSGPHRDLSDGGWRLVADIGDLLRLPILGRLADRIGTAELLVLERRNELFVQAISGPHPKCLVRLVENVEHSSVCTRKLN